MKEFVCLTANVLNIYYLEVIFISSKACYRSKVLTIYLKLKLIIILKYNSTPELMKTKQKNIDGKTRKKLGLKGVSIVFVINLVRLLLENNK